MRIAIRIRQFNLLPIIMTAMCIGMAPAWGCDDLPKLRASIATGDWAAAMTATEACVKATRASVPPPPVRIGWQYIDMASVYFWQLDLAILNARLGHAQAAEKNLADALTWKRHYNPGEDAFRTIDWEGMAHMARGYLAERLGNRTGAAQEYKRVEFSITKGHAHARLALLALDSGDESMASIEAQGDEPEPTALYVRGAIEERRGALLAAIRYYETALNAITQRRHGNRSVSDTLLSIDRDRIAIALENARKRQR